MSLKIKEFFIAPRQPAQLDRLLEVVAFAVVNYVVVVDGRWKILIDTWNSDMPMPMPGK